MPPFVMNTGSSKSDNQFAEDITASPDIMWSSSQTGCGPLHRLLMDVEDIPVHQSTQAVSSTTLQAVTGMARTKATSAPASLFSSGSSTAVLNSGSSKSRSLKRTRSGSHVFEKSPVLASNKVPESQSLQLLGKGKLGTEILARVSHSLNEKAISGFANSQKSATKHVTSNHRTQLPLQSRLNTDSRCRNSPEHLTIDSTSNHNLGVETTAKSTRGHLVVTAKPPISLKDSPKKGRLKALLQEISREKKTSDHYTHKADLPTQNAALSQKGSERPSEDESTESGQSSKRVSQSTIASRDAIGFSKPLPQKVSYDVQPNTKLVESRRRKSISSPAPAAPPKRSYRTENQTAKVGSMSLCLTDDEEKLGLEEPDQPTIGTTTQDSLDDDTTYNDANSSSSYGDLDIDANLLEEVCKEYDT